MNERIRELMAQAGFDPAAIERMGVMPQAEKFAELIIRECCNITNNLEGVHNPGDCSTVEYIKEHFGVTQ